jgi:hypothetical protein
MFIARYLFLNRAEIRRAQQFPAMKIIYGSARVIPRWSILPRRPSEAGSFWTTPTGLLAQHPARANLKARAQVTLPTRRDYQSNRRDTYWGG